MIRRNNQTETAVFSREKSLAFCKGCFAVLCVRMRGGKDLDHSGYDFGLVVSSFAASPAQDRRSRTEISRTAKPRAISLIAPLDIFRGVIPRLLLGVRDN